MALNFPSRYWRKAGEWLLSASGFLYVFSLFLPGLSGPPLLIDDSWQLALHAAFVHQMQFGRDVIFTFGPWGFLYGGFYPPTFPVAILVWTVLAFVFWWAGWRVACHCAANKFFAWIWFVGFAGIAGIPGNQDVDVRMAGWTVLLWLLHFFVEDRALSVRQALLVVFGGLLALVKVTGLIGMTAVVLVIAADNVFRRRQFPWIMFLFAGSILLFWMVAGQGLSRLWPFLHYSWLLAGGYPEALMRTAGGEVENLAGLLLAIVTLIMATGYVAWARRRRLAFFPVAGLGAILFLLFKHVCVRYDPLHEVTGVLELLLVALACWAATWRSWRQSRWWVWSAGVLALAGLFLFCAFTFDRCCREAGLPDVRLGGLFVSTLNVKANLAPVALLCDPARVRKIHEQNLAEVQARYPLPRLQGGTDVYPWNQAALFANGLQYDPRPVFHSYSVYAPMLAELNAAHLRGADAPDNILFDLDPINEHFPSMEDGLSWLELLTRYDVQAVTGQFIILKHVARPRTCHLTPLADIPVRFGEPVTVAANPGLVWAEWDIDRTLWGSIVTILYKPPALQLSVSLQDGRQLSFQLVPGMARSGFLLSPLIRDKSAYRLLNSPGGWHNLVGCQIESLTVSARPQSGSTANYRSPIRLRLYHLVLSDGQ